MKQLLLLIFTLLTLTHTCYSQAPIANAGNNQTITLPTNSVTLSGTSSTGNIKSYSWSKLSGVPKTVKITTPNKVTTTVTNLPQGTFSFSLTIVGRNNSLTGNKLQSSTAYVTVTVQASSACIPVNTPRTFVLPTTAAHEIYRPNVSSYRAGDTLEIDANNGPYDVIEFVGLNGSACQHIIIKPINGTVVDNGRFAFNVMCSYVDVVGWQSGSNPYGFYVNGVIGCVESHHMSFNWMEGTNPSGVGMFFKENPDTTNPCSMFPNCQMTKISILHCFIHDTGGEGMYIGSATPNGEDDGGIPPSQMDSVEIAYCKTKNTGWDGIQLSDALYGDKIHDDTVINYGVVNMGSQQAGIILGGNCSGEVYNNIIQKGTGNGIEVFGFGVLNIYNNTTDSCGHDLTTNGQQTFFSNSYTITVNPTTPQQINIYSNNFSHFEKISVVRVQNDNGTALGATCNSNHICDPNIVGAPIILDPSGSSQTGNTFSCP